MGSNVKRILYATDLSPNSEHAFGFAASMARESDARIVILHVLDKSRENWEAFVYAHLNEWQMNELHSYQKAQTVERIRRRLDVLRQTEFAEDQQFCDRVIDIDIQVGDPAEVILGKAEELGSDCIVLGSHNKGELRAALFGSTSRQVVRRTRTPTVVIPLPEGQTDLTFHDEALSA